ncbi:MAG: DEAD/DEAH box helicase [Pseudomonadota bacterium]
MTDFKSFGLAEPLLRALKAEGYETPTPIQTRAIPVLLKNQDVVGIAQTGTGKTAAFTLPVLNRIIEDKCKRVPKACSALILAPTRELAAQIVQTIQVYSQFTQVSVALIVGGLSSGPQVKIMRGGVDIIVATPGRLLDHMDTGAITLDWTKTVVLDEADQMMDLGFLPDIRKVVQSIPSSRSTALFSATMPKEIRRLANDFLDNPVEVAVAAASKPIERIEQSVQLVERSEKRTVLTELVSEEDVESAVVFTRTKRGADRISWHLKDAGFAVDAIHGNKSQGQRARALKQFKNGEIAILVATDIAARGIDIDGVSHVFNFDLPEVPEAYVHRIGRTARAGRSGVAISLYEASESHLLRAIEKLTGSRIEGRPRRKKDQPSRARTPAGHVDGKPRFKKAAA